MDDDYFIQCIYQRVEAYACYYATPGTQAMADSIRGPISQSKTILLSHHGTLTVGHTLEEALIALERLEHTAHSYFVAKTLGRIIPLPADEMERL